MLIELYILGFQELGQVQVFQQMVHKTILELLLTQQQKRIPLG
jgi:hypothetical protein